MLIIRWRILIMNLLCLLLGLFLVQVFGINFQLTKKNILIPKDSQYLATVDIQRQNAELIPVNISLLTTINNALPSYNNYFDYFYCFTPQDINCYRDSINNQSYLYPCPFIENKYSQMRTTQVQGNRINQSVDQIKNMQFSFIVDNTLYPYPSGAYSYSPITIDVALQVSISISPNYEILGKRLIWINVTVFMIFILIITILVCKTRRLSKQMDTSKMSQIRRSEIQEAMSRRFDSSESEQEEQVQESGRELREKLILQQSQELEDDRNEEMAETRPRKRSVQSRFPLSSLKGSLIE